MTDPTENVDVQNVIDLFGELDRVTAGNQLGVVACALALSFATCILEAMEPGDDLEDSIKMGLREFERNVREAISGTGPVALRPHESKTN